MHKEGSPEETTVSSVQIHRQNPLKNNRVTISLKVFSHKLNFATVLVTLANMFLALDFSFGCCAVSKQGSWALFWPINDNTEEWV